MRAAGSNVLTSGGDSRSVRGMRSRAKPGVACPLGAYVDFDGGAWDRADAEDL